MQLEEALKLADKLVFAKTGSYLNHVQKAVFQGAWQGDTYQEIAEAYKFSTAYLNQEVGPQVWQLLSKAFGEKVSKKNLRAVLERQASRDTAMLQVPKAQTVPHQFQALIAEKTKGFVGREYVFAAITDFLVKQPNGYFIIVAEPGMGKSAILAEYVRRTECIVHFNMRLQGINHATQFLESICTQLIARYSLPFTSLPLEATRDGNFLAQLLNEVSAKLEKDEKLVIAIDALDEVDLASQDAGANILYLPAYLPQGVYFLLTQRRVMLPLAIHTPQHFFNLEEYGNQSRQDIEHYIQNATRSPRLRAWIDKRQINIEEFVIELANKSENNFMYLRYILPQIEQGFYQDLSIESLPKGLESYYEDHWRRMGMTVKPLMLTKLKIVYILGEIRQPVSRRLIADFAKENQITVQYVLDEWEQFLQEELIDEQTCYSIYHGSFQDFLHRKDIVQAAGVDIKSINAMIADSLWESLFGDE